MTNEVITYRVRSVVWGRESVYDFDNERDAQRTHTTLIMGIPYGSQGTHMVYWEELDSEGNIIK